MHCRREVITLSVSIDDRLSDQTFTDLYGVYDERREMAEERREMVERPIEDITGRPVRYVDNFMHNLIDWERSGQQTDQTSTTVVATSYNRLV